MKEFKFLTKNKDIERLHPYIIPRNIINITPIMYNPETHEPVRGITYNVDGERNFSMIGEDHPLWNEVTDIV